MDKEKVEIPIDHLTDLLNYRREYFLICEEFKIPIGKRHFEGTATAIIERVHTYLSGYTMRRSIVERENGAAFKNSPPVVVTDPLDTDEKK